MKKFFAMLATAVLSLTMMAQEPIITFDRTEHDFGTIKEEGGRVTTEFEFRNDGLSALILSNVRASCGCTTPKWTKEPIEPGETGKITVTYNPNGRPGRFQKTVTVTSNATEPTKKLYIKGEVTPKPAKEVNTYNVQMGDLSMKSKVVALGALKNDEKRTKEIEYANLTDHEITVDLQLDMDEPSLLAQPSLMKLQPKETGKLQVILDGAKKKTFGPVETFVYVIVNGKMDLSDEYKVVVTADYVEDFSQMTTEELQMAPLMISEDHIELGTFRAGNPIKKTIKVKNAGNNPLKIHQIFSKENKYIGPKSPIKNGKTGDIKVEIETKDMKPGQYNRVFTIISNDPKQSRKKVALNFTIE